MRTKLIVMTIIMVILSGFGDLAQAETLQSHSGGKYVLLFKSQDQMDFAIKHINAGGSCMDLVYTNTLVGMPESGTKVAVIKSTWTTKRVRVMEGPFTGKIGWTPSEMVSP